MKTIDIEGFEITGFFARTKNSDESHKSTAKIPQLWNRFYADLMTSLSESPKIYGVYTEYESDYTGEFTVVAGSTALSHLKIEDAKNIKIVTGHYLLFSGKGEMPQVVIDLWGEIWTYFNVDSCPHKRAYTTDFEYYKRSSDIEIYISVE